MFIKAYSELRFIIPTFIHSAADVADRRSKIWSAAFRFDRNVQSLFPYINTVLDEAVYYANPEHVRFQFEGYRCFLYPRSAAAHFFENRTAAREFIAGLIDFLNDIAARRDTLRPNYDQVRQVPLIDILKILPRTNCRECGYPSCMAFAAAIVSGKAAIDACPCLDTPISENAVYPVFDARGNLVNSVSLRINTSGLKNRLQEQRARIRTLEASLKADVPDDARVETSRSAAKDTFGLTGREIETLKLIAEGYTNNEISGLLFISPHTVKSHMINIFNKMGVNDRTRAAVLATRSGII